MATATEFKKIHESSYGDDPDNYHLSRNGDTLTVELTYPPYTERDNTKGKLRYVEIDQESVRASDGVRLYYDFDRDGFVIQQPQPVMIDRGDYSEVDENWTEVAFVQSWALTPAGFFD